MKADEPSAQLMSDLEKNVHAASSTRRPIIHHLNADTTWFLQLPRPGIDLQKGSRLYYNLLIDPWLSGSQSDVANWFSRQFHADPSAVASIAALEQLAWKSEKSAASPPSDSREGNVESNGVHKSESGSAIDAVVISHEFSDHCHKETLLEVHPSVPLFAIKEAAKLIRKWKHFQTIVVIESFATNGNADWRSTTQSPLPSWIGISRLLQTDDVLNFHSAVMITFTSPSQTPSAEAIIYTPHGISSGDLNLISSASPPITTLAFLHGLHNVRVGTAGGRTALQTNLGAYNGLQAQRLLKARYWISTHDEVKTGSGLVSWFLQRDVISVEEALEEERKATNKGYGSGADEDLVKAFEGTNWVELRNGEKRVLV